MTFKEVIRDVAMQKLYLVLMGLDYGGRLPVFGGFADQVIVGRTDQRSGRQDRT
jgi:hypothetical protein